jgi:hypothetical protein
MSQLVVHAETSVPQVSPALTALADVWKVKLSVVEGALTQASIKITVANVVTHVPEANSAAMAAVRARQVISSATAHALIRTSTTTTVGNAEMFVVLAHPVPQELAFLTLDNFNILPLSYK